MADDSLFLVVEKTLYLLSIVAAADFAAQIACKFHLAPILKYAVSAATWA